MKNKIKWWWGCTSAISLATIALTTTLSATTNHFQSKLGEVLTITNNAIDVNDSRLSTQFRQTFSTLDADQLSDLANRTTLVQLILKELITYRDQSAIITPIFSTGWTFSEFYYQFSQIQAQVVDPADAISFSYGNQGPFKNLANGELKVKITIGKNLKNQFSFANGEDDVEITFFGFQKQYDWYQRTNAKGQSDWNVNNVANDHIVNPYQLPNRHDRTLWNDIKNLQDPQQFVYDYLIKYEHQLGQVINGSKDPDLANQVLATNLDRDQLIAQKAIEKVNLEPFFASGKIHLQIWIKQSPWRADKLTLLNDQFGTWNGLKTNLIDLWIGGWKKDYSFAMQPNQDPIISFDSKHVAIGNQTLSNWSVDQLATMVAQGDHEILDQALINFSDYLNPDQAKLINTRLRYQEWKTIGAKLNYQIMTSDHWNGTLKLKVYFDPKWTNLHFVDPLGSGFKKIERFNFTIEFNHLKPEQNLIQQAKQFNWSWLNQSTISNYFAINDFDAIDFEQITNVVKTKLINYQPSGQNDFALTTNATNANALDRFKISRFEPDWNQGRVQISWEYQVDANTIFNGIEYLKPTVIKQSFIINGFQAEPRQKYHFDVAKDLEIDINDFNQTSNQAPIYFANQIDQKWIINNLINFANQAAKPNALFTTDATLKAFNEQLLVANGISLNLSGDQSYLDGKIKLNRQALVGNFNEDVVFHFRIKGLVAKKQFIHLDHLVANKLNLDEIDRNWVLNNLISFSDYQVANPALIVNQSRKGWLTTSFANLTIEKSYQNHQATIRFQFQDQPDLVSTISGLIANVRWDFNWHLNLDQDLIVRYQSGDDLIANLVNFGDDQNLKKQTWLNTNVSRQEFFTTYFQGLVIKDRNLYDNYLQFEIKVLGIGVQRIWVQFSQDAVNIFDLDPYYQAKGYDPNQIDQDWLESQIDFAGSRINQPSWFRTNLTKSQFQTWFKWNLLVNDQSIGALKFALNSQVKFNFDHFQDFATGIETLNLNLFGFKAGGQFSFENQVNGQLNFNLAQLTNANQLNESFIYDHLITYQSQKPIMGTIATTNLTKAQLQQLSKLVIEINDTSVVLKFNFASALNQQQLDQAVITINNLKFLKQPWSQFDLNLIIIITAFALIFAIGGTILGWQIRRLRQQKAAAFKHQLKQQNRLL